MKYGKRCALLIIMVSLPLKQLFATAQDDFRAGLQAYKAKQFTRAIQSFERARQQGMHSSALYYNLAVSYFQTADYDQASNYFNKTRQDSKLKHLSEYNLGLVAVKQNRRKTALKYFKSVARNASQKNLVTLANYQIAQLEEVKIKRVMAFFQLEYGHDDNVTTATNETATKLGSDYRDLYVYGAVRLAGGKHHDLSLDGYILDTQYSATRVYDIQFRSLRLSQAFTLGKWFHRAGISYISTMLGENNVAFQDTLLYELNSKASVSGESELRLRYRFYDIDSQAPYTELTGTKQRLRVEYRWLPKPDKLRLLYEYETNQRSETATTPGSYSPTRHTLRAAYTYALTDNWSATADFSYRLSDFPAGATDPVRQDRRSKTDFELAYHLSKSWFLTAEYSYTNNASNLAAYEYQRRLTSLSINASF